MVKSLSPKQFKARDINKILGIDKNKLFYWIRTYRLLKPEIEEAKGIGTRSIFSLKNLLELVTIKEMLKFGTDLNTIKQIKDQMDKSDIFGYVLREEYKEAKFLYIYKSGKKIEIKLREEQMNPEVDVGLVHPAYSPADDQLDPGVYCAVRLELGKLAKDLMDKINQL